MLYSLEKKLWTPRMKSITTQSRCLPCFMLYSFLYEVLIAEQRFTLFEFFFAFYWNNTDICHGMDAYKTQTYVIVSHLPVVKYLHVFSRWRRSVYELEVIWEEMLYIFLSGLNTRKTDLRKMGYLSF